MIGAHFEALSTAGPYEVVAHLHASHALLRRLLAEARAIAMDGGMSEPFELARRARDVQRYFAAALALHEADEERSVAPRLWRAANASMSGISERMDEHVKIEALMAELAEDWRHIAATGTLPADVTRHQMTLARLDAALSAHLESEEYELFPRIAALSRKDRFAIVNEMRERWRALSDAA